MLSRCGEARVEIKPNIDRAVSAAQSGRGHRSPWDGPVHCRVPHRRQYRDRVSYPITGAPLGEAGYAQRAREEGRRQPGGSREAGGARSLARRHGWGVLDLHGLTASLPRAASWDGIHFREEVTLCLNHGLAAALSSQSPSGESL